MRRILFCFLALAMLPLGLWVVIPALAQDKMAGTGAIPGVRGEYIEVLNYFEQRYVRLAEAIPADKYTWRPAEGVRSISEVSSMRLSRTTTFLA